jgi:hypothetical protein
LTLSREHKYAIGFFLGGLVGGIIISRVRLTANMASLARVAIAGVHAGRRLNGVDLEGVVTNAMQGVVATWGTRGNQG